MPTFLIQANKSIILSTSQVAFVPLQDTSEACSACVADVTGTVDLGVLSVELSSCVDWLDKVSANCGIFAASFTRVLVILDEGIIHTVVKSKVITAIPPRRNPVNFHTPPRLITARLPDELWGHISGDQCRLIEQHHHPVYGSTHIINKQLPTIVIIRLMQIWLFIPCPEYTSHPDQDQNHSTDRPTCYLFPQNQPTQTYSYHWIYIGVCHD